MRRGKVPGLDSRAEENRLTPMPPASLRVLLSESIDYAGLFPPAALSLPDACAQYRSARESADAWALGRFVVPASRLRELASVVPADNAPWRVAALLGDDLTHDASVIDEMAVEGSLVIEAAEARAPSVSAIHAAADALRGRCQLYAEIPVEDDPEALVSAVARVGARAKMRTGGVVANAFPRAADVARFIACCHSHAVPFKATAGLHHPIRGDYHLTHDADSACGTMFGFLNLFVAAVVARTGASQASIVALLDERDPAALHFSEHDIRWRKYVLPVDHVAATRDTFAISFGSCSFLEPVEDLRQLGLL